MPDLQERIEGGVGTLSGVHAVEVAVAAKAVTVRHDDHAPLTG